MTVSEGRFRVRQEFEKYSNYFTDLIVKNGQQVSPQVLAAMNTALLKGTQELIEVHNRWAQRTHVMRWFEGAWEEDSPVVLAANREKEIKKLNSVNGSVNGVGGVLKKDSSNFLSNFLTK